MSILLALDFETTGPDPKTCLPIEFACQTYDSETKQRGRPYSLLIWDKSYPEISDEITELTGITNKELLENGVGQDIFINVVSPLLENSDVLVAYNAQFDRAVLFNSYDSFGKRKPDKPWLCAMSDLPWPAKMQTCRKLQHRALDLGLPMDNRDAHRAAADVNLLLDIFDLYPMEDVLEYWKLPWIYLAAQIPGPWTDGGKGRDEAKAAGFGWEAAPGDSERKFSKQWVIRLKQGEEVNYPFRVEYLK